VGKSLSKYDEVLLSNGDIRPIGEIVEEKVSQSSKIERLNDGVMTTENPEGLKVFGLNPKTMKIEEKNILAFIKRKGEKQLYKIQTRTGRSIVTTGCHPVMIFRDNMIISEMIGKLKNGDLIATPSIIKLDSKGLDIETKLEISSPDEIFARFLGYIIGDGYIGSNRFDFTNEDDDLIQDIIYLSKKLNLKPKIKIDGKIKILKFYSIKFYRFLFDLFELKKISSETKHIPKIFLFANEKIISNLLAALFDCDAYIRKDQPGFEYSTKSKKLAYQVQFLLLRLGIVSLVREKLKRATNSPKQRKEKYYSVYVCGIENIKKIYEKIPLISKTKKERIKLFLSKNIKPQRSFEDVLPKDVNNVVKNTVKLLGLEVKKLRKQYPSLASYVENRCYPTTDGLKKILPLFSRRLNELISYEKNMKKNEIYLIEILGKLKIWRKEVAKFIGISSSLFYNWINSKSKPCESHLNQLFNFAKIKLKERIEQTKNLIKILENLISSDIFWDKIVKIEKVPGEKWVYDLSIPDCHNFIANGIFVHNSNVIDAICFVLGRTSAKSLRAERLHELIFHGGNGKKPADYAAVSLYLDNTNKIFPFEEQEVSVTRKVNRKGVSIYKLNGKTTTREKVLEALSAVRIYPDGHNIVLQGDVTNVIEMNPVERRYIIDEISGIAEYNDKKEKASKDLEAVDAKLKEAEIVITERYDIFKRLEEERNAAVRYQQLQKQLQTLKASLAFRKLSDFEEKSKELEADIAKKEEENEKLQKEIENIEQELEKREKGIQEVAEKIIKISKRIEVEKEISYLRTKILIDKDKIDSNKKEIERLESLMSRLQVIESKKAEVGEMPRAVKAVLDQNIKGVHGTVAGLIKVPEKYQIAAEVAAGHHMNDIIVDSDEIAKFCIDFLKREKIGRATFLPLNKIKATAFKETDLLKSKNVLGVASKLIKFDSKFADAVEFIFGNTLVVETLDDARAIGIGKARMVTLDGDLVERSGAMVGGYYARIPRLATAKDEIEEYQKLKTKLEEEIKTFSKEIEEFENKLKQYEKSGEIKEFVDLEKLKVDSEQELDVLRQKRKIGYEKRLTLQTEINKLKIMKAKFEAELENVRIEIQQYGDVKPVDKAIRTLEIGIRESESELMSLGAVNFKAIEQYEKFKAEFDGYKTKYEKILEEKKAVLNMIEQIETKRREVFNRCMQELSLKFDKLFQRMTGGNASLILENPLDLESGLIIQANPGGKMLLNIDAMSGGEKTLTALAFLFAVQEYKPAPFYVLDEIDAALDKENTKKIADLIKDMSKEAQFIVITHNDMTIKYGDRVYGVTMSEGESKILGLELPKG
jgi:chromosome segregation protein